VRMCEKCEGVCVLFKCFPTLANATFPGNVPIYNGESVSLSIRQNSVHRVPSEKGQRPGSLKTKTN
jgi:hypothetical protein